MTDEPTPIDPPEGLQERGLRLWAALELEGCVRGSAVVLCEEAARLADRLEQLDRLLRGDTAAWCSVRSYEDGRDTELVIDKAAAESRAGQAQLAALLRQLTTPVAAAPAKGSTTTTGGTPHGGVDQVAAARAARLAAAAGPASS